MERSRRTLLRTLLAAGSVGLAGCDSLGEASPEGSPSRGSPGEQPRSGTDGGGGESTPPDDSPGSSRTPRTDPSPTFELRITNTDDRAHSLTTGTWTFPFVRLGPAGDSLLVLENTDWGLTPPSGGDVECWKAPLVPVDPTSRGIRFDPGESLTREYLICNHVDEMDDSADCWPPGEYGFRYVFWLDSPSLHLREGHPFTWHLDLRVDDVPSISVPSAGLSWGSFR
jgi:hypothetical protein